VKRVLGIAALVIGCASSSGVPEVKVASSRREAAAMSRSPQVELFYKGEQPWARRGSEEWSLGDVTKGEMVFSPDGKRFAYVRQSQTASNRGAEAKAHVLVRNLAGDPVNDFTAYRPGEPQQLSWIDNRRLGYLAPPDPIKKQGTTFVVHDAETGEVLAARSGSQFTWDGKHHHVAFIVGRPGQQVLVVDGRNIWPRAGVTRLHGEPVWSNDGHGLAMIDEGNGTPRLVVMVEYADPQGDLTWPVPREALAPGLRIYWATDSKVIIGEDKLKPKFAAGWERLQ
jgi:hypothetical protein